MIIIMMSALYLTNNLSYISELTKQSTDIYMSFQSDTFVSDSEPTTLCGYICRSNRTHVFLILNQLLFAGIYVVPIGHICFWFWTNYSLRVYMSFQSATFVSDYEPTTLCGYICRSNRTHLFLIMNQLLFAGIYIVPIGHICFWFWTNYSALAPYCCLSPVKQHITLVWLFVWPDQGLIPRSTVIMFTITLPTMLAKHAIVVMMIRT
jgi:hypothetical protein